MVSTKTLLTAFALLVSTAAAAGVCKECTSSPNNCDITAPCANAFGERLLCGCRPGYRAGSSSPSSKTVNPDDTTKQWRFDFPYAEHRVWVAPGVVCDQLCDFPYGSDACAEVPFTKGCVTYPPPPK